MWTGKRRKRGSQSPLSKDSTCFCQSTASSWTIQVWKQPSTPTSPISHHHPSLYKKVPTHPIDQPQRTTRTTLPPLPPSHPDRTFQPPQPGPKSKSPAHTINPPLAREGTRKKGHRRQTNPLPAQPAGNRPAQTIQIDLASAAALGPAACATEEFGGGGAYDRDLGSGRADPGPRRDLVSTHTCMSAHTPTELFSARSGLCGAGVCVFGGGRQAAECFRR